MARDPRVDTYLATLPPDQRAALERVRTEIARVVPDAVETIAYGIPTFRINGRVLVSFAGWKAYCSIYPLTDTFLREHADVVKAYGRTKGSLHFTPDAPLPEGVVEQLVRARLAELEGGRAG